MHPDEYKALDRENRGSQDGQPRLPMKRCGALIPVLRTVENARNLDRVRLDLIDNDVRQRRECKFTPSGHAAAGSSKIGKILQASALVIDRSRHAVGRLRIVPFNPFADVL